MSSTAEAEIGALYLNAKEATVIRTTLDEMGHPQPATPMETDNSTACGIMNRTVKQVRSKAIDMHFYWVRDRVKQGHFRIYWASKILQTILLNTTHQPTIAICDPSFSTKYIRLASQSTCEGVLNPELHRR
jgi:hypothetical protein